MWFKQFLEGSGFFFRPGFEFTIVSRAISILKLTLEVLKPSLSLLVKKYIIRISLTQLH